MSRDGQGPPVAALPAGLTVDLAPTDGFDWHAHGHHQIALAARGVLVMGVEGATWVLPPTRALWIPAGARHSLAVAGRTTMLSTYVDPGRCPVTWAEPTVVDASGLLGELVRHLSRHGLAAGERARAESLLWDLTAPLPVTTLSTPLPVDERARAVAEGLRADVTDGRSLAAWGRAVGASARTLARLFPAETGMGFERWRTTARLAAALPLLASGAPVGATAHRVGYATPSAFVAAFRREIGTTPAEYFRPR
ncbi:MAG TPA: helix-turn-helix transcriptional regulator [Acidimicrobiales bacterium]|nr:helix-turn-helix transcriptional regulator [Acidimicrobiales bacterium]